MFNPKRTPPKPVLRQGQSLFESDLVNCSSAEVDSNVTCRKRKQPECEHDEILAVIREDFHKSSSIQAELQKTLNEWKVNLDGKLAAINDNITSIRGDLETFMRESKKEMANLRSENVALRNTVSKLSEEVAEVKTSAQHISDQYDDFQKHLSHINKQTSSVTLDTIRTLELKIDYLEQQGRQCNLEISNVPERRGENLPALMEDIGKKVDHNISRNDITSIHRVPHASSSERPKNIIVSLKTRSLRDNIIAACRLKKGFTSKDLGIAGTPHTIYVNEHLTLQKKQLLRDFNIPAAQWAKLDTTHNYMTCLGTSPTCNRLKDFLIIHDLKQLNHISNPNGRILDLLISDAKCTVLKPTQDLLPSLVFRVMSHPKVPDFQQCVSFEAFANQQQELAYNVFCLGAVYFLPLTIISVCYACIFYEISKNSKENSEKYHQSDHSRIMLRRSDQRPLARARRRTLRMTVTIVTVFACCWLPYATMTLW
ncbi:hypothetical protein PYW08_002637 [Mythimna loreyi]|uniref:Uncharacterized protein n=1 Tax=Mythimna loreyi TaxID=667449 RepID=A0ACC2QKH4_9NEOP|nr:hypothetical protein PYW08_002637 [Mythimna loreyi]